MLRLWICIAKARRLRWNAFGLLSETAVCCLQLNFLRLLFVPRPPIATSAILQSGPSSSQASDKGHRSHFKSW
ncbi:hypothetical protein BD311DRAFT_760159 [Dichomitus squalens]|uniref:Uncharacterized protein n=1 Tax=Dichomitus squalens TaxID=114155 RepID=A0A4V2K060_9APHY|nr:hypothetical protein BD311DRAFT_760159 [Dichomitus squalens]